MSGNRVHYKIFGLLATSVLVIMVLIVVWWNSRSSDSTVLAPDSKEIVGMGCGIFFPTMELLAIKEIKEARTGTQVFIRPTLARKIERSRADGSLVFQRKVIIEDGIWYQQHSISEDDPETLTDIYVAGTVDDLELPEICDDIGKPPKYD